MEVSSSIRRAKMMCQEPCRFLASWTNFCQISAHEGEVYHPQVPRSIVASQQGPVVGEVLPSKLHVMQYLTLISVI